MYIMKYTGAKLRNLTQRYFLFSVLYSRNCNAVNKTYLQKVPTSTKMKILQYTRKWYELCVMCLCINRMTILCSFVRVTLLNILKWNLFVLSFAFSNLFFILWYQYCIIEISAIISFNLLYKLESAC